MGYGQSGNYKEGCPSSLLLSHHQQFSLQHSFHKDSLSNSNSHFEFPFLTTIIHNPPT